MADVTLPPLGESVTEGTVTRWLKRVGDEVAVDDPLVEVSTDKVDTEIPSPVAGTLLEIKMPEDETAAIGAVLAVIGVASDESFVPDPEPVDRPNAAAPGLGAGGVLEPEHTAVLGGDTRAEAAQPTVLPAAPGEQPAPGPQPVRPSPLRGTVAKLSRLRKIIAARMVDSLQTSAQLTSVVEVDVTAIGRLRDSVKDDFAAREGVKLSYMPFFAKAALDALKEHPVLNAEVDMERGQVTYHDREHLAIAVDTERGLLTPVVRNAGELSIAGLARKIADLAERSRDNRIGPDELSGGTFTLTNTGSRGALFDTPILNQPQVGILGTGAVVERPVVIHDAKLGKAIAIRRMVYLALTYDHRVVDGADAARFLSNVKQRLELGAFEV